MEGEEEEVWLRGKWSGGRESGCCFLLTVHFLIHFLTFCCSSYLSSYKVYALLRWGDKARVKPSKVCTLMFLSIFSSWLSLGYGGGC